MDDKFDGLISGFYKAATGDQTWDQALDGVSEAFGARCVMLHDADLRTGQILSLSQGGAPMKEQTLDYVRRYHHVDPRRARILPAVPALVGKWWHCHEHISDEVVAEDEFHQQFLPSLNVRFQSTLILKPAEDVGTAFAIELPGSRGVLNEDEREYARRLGQHLNDALRAHQRIRRLAAEVLAGHTLLKAFPFPMWLLDFDRFVHFESELAARQTSSALRLFLREQHLLASNPKTDSQLTEQLHLLRTAQHGASSAISLREHGLDTPAWLHLSVLVPQAVFGAFGSQPLVLLTLFDPQEVHALDPFAIGNLLGLTPAQARVAAGLAEGKSAEEIAVKLGCAVPTVRTHVRAVLARLGAQRAADVVNILHQGGPLWSRASLQDSGPRLDAP